MYQIKVFYMQYTELVLYVVFFLNILENIYREV